MTNTPDSQRTRARILSRHHIAAVLDWATCIGVVESALSEHAAGRATLPSVGHVKAHGGTFHIKAAGLTIGRPYVAVKLNGNFPGNPKQSGLPTIQGAVLLCDGENGRLLAILESAELTAWRTAAATAIAAKYLARPDARVAVMVGCGAQAPHHLGALCHVLPLERVLACDIDLSAAQRFAAEADGQIAVEVIDIANLGSALPRSDVIVTCTSSRHFFVGPEHVGPGMFVAAVGADAPEKQELDPRVLAGSHVVVDVLDQCAMMGELHHAMESGVMTAADVHAELGEIISGSKPGRVSAAETFVFDSTGAAIEDVAVAVAAFQRASDQLAGDMIDLRK